MVDKFKGGGNMVTHGLDQNGEPLADPAILFNNHLEREKGNIYRIVSRVDVLANQVSYLVFETNDNPILIENSSAQLINDSAQVVNVKLQSYDEGVLDNIGQKSQENIYNMKGSSSKQSTLYLYDETTTVLDPDINSRKIPFYVEFLTDRRSQQSGALTVEPYEIKSNTINILKIDNSANAVDISLVIYSTYLEMTN